MSTDISCLKARVLIVCTVVTTLRAFLLPFADHDRAGLEALAEQLDLWGYPVATYQQCDLSDREEIAATARLVLAEQGDVDILINNAGIVSGKPLLELTDEAIERTFDINTLALFRTTRCFLPGMIRKGSGHIVTVASAGGLIGVPKMTDYSASKFAAIGFDESLRFELKRLGHRGIRTTVVCPYYINTGMTQGGVKLDGTAWGDSIRWLGNFGLRWYWQTDDLSPSGDNFTYFDLKGAAIFPAWGEGVHPVIEATYLEDFGQYNALTLSPELILTLGPDLSLKAGIPVGLGGEGNQLGATAQFSYRF